MNDYQYPIIACLFLFLAMISYWTSLWFSANKVIFTMSKIFVFASNLLFVCTLASRWINEHYFPLSNLYESLMFLAWSLSTFHLLLENIESGVQNSRTAFSVFNPGAKTTIPIHEGESGSGLTQVSQKDKRFFVGAFVIFSSFGSWFLNIIIL